MRAFVFAAVVVLCPLVAIGQQQAPPAPATAETPASLPVRRVVLYKTGVGYFEHQGQVRDNQNVTIRFTSRQLNDVLKSLTTIDPKGRIGNISYNSAAPIEQRLNALRLPLGAESSTFDVLAALRGARVEVGSGTGLVQGRLLGIERKDGWTTERKVQIQELSVMTDSGSVQAIELTPATSVRVIDRDMRQEIGRYLDVIGSTRERDVRNMVISTIGTGERPLFVSYVSEVPVWKSTYRLVIPASGSPFLQGWAIVDSTVGEDWRNVELSLVAGAPQSFIQNISQPYYTRRPVVPMPGGVLTSPQAHAGGTPPSESPANAIRATLQAMPPPPAASRGVNPGTPGGVMGGVVGGMPEAPPPAPYDQLRDIEPQAIASDLGDLFEYRVKEPVTLQKDQSALVPIVNGSIGAEKLSLWNRGASSGHPLRALWLSNTTGVTLDGGSITIIDGNAFAGEGLVEPLAQGAKRLVSYASDLGIVVNGRFQTSTSQSRRVRAFEGSLIQEMQEQASLSYAIRNEEASAATVLVEHRLRPGWTIADDLKPEETTGNAARFRVSVPPREARVLVVREVRRHSTTLNLYDVDMTVIASITKTGISADRLMAAFKPVLDKKAEVATRARHASDLAKEHASIVADQERLRENMKALRGTAEERSLLQRYTKQLDAQENRLDALKPAIAQAEDARARAQDELSKLLVDLSFDITS